ncbi:MAG: metallophosphoesterase [Nitrososphaerota archaeon]|nr:metallophosphoesterase [Nitrososphaerota archaeon]
MLESGTRYLVISDLHIGLEESLSRKGLHLPGQSIKMAKHATELGNRNDCSSLVLLGDVKDEILGVSPWGLVALSQFFETVMSGFSEVILIPGNHDGGIEQHIPPGVKLVNPHGILIRSVEENGKEEKVALLHGHADPSPAVASADTYIVGHRHFMFRVGRKPQPLWIRGRFGKGLDKYLIVVPPFNHLLPGAMGLEGRSGARSKNSFVARAVDGAEDSLEALLLDGTNLGSLKSLKGSLGAVDN